MVEELNNRVKAIQEILVNGYNAGKQSSSATKGNEREYFISTVLSSFFPMPYRFGTGDIIDSDGKRTGQLDVVMEYALIPSIPVFGSNSPRLYIGEGVAAVIEVKSNIESQWEEVDATGEKVKELNRDLTHAGYTKPMKSKIPYLAVGFEGWKKSATLLKKVNSSNIDAALIINSNCFANRKIDDVNPKVQEYKTNKTDVALWRFVKFLYTIIGSGSIIAYDINDHF